MNAPSNSAIRSLSLRGPAGSLEALLNTGSPRATHAALVCHPHPQFGGTMHNKVVYAAAKAVNSLGWPVLRFNFRGTGLSQGEHDQGRGEVDDVRAALDWLAGEFSLPIVFAGFSFGAAVGLHAACPDARVVAVISLGTPIHAEDRLHDYDHLRQCAKPKLFVSGSRDPYAKRELLEKLVAGLPEPKRLVLIEGVGHFFEGHLPRLRRVIIEWAGQITNAKPRTG